MRKIQFAKLFFCLSIPLMLGFLGSMATASSVNTWYTGLVKPSFNPPNTVFAPVWTCLYLLMGISSYLIIDLAKSSAQKKAIFIYGLQLLLNCLWSIVFFYCKQPNLALVVIVLLWCSIVYMLYLFFKLNKTAFYLNLPYIVWVSFATVLNAALWWLNK
jgi:translocator protein